MSTSLSREMPMPMIPTSSSDNPAATGSDMVWDPDMNGDVNSKWILWASKVVLLSPTSSILTPKKSVLGVVIAFTIIFTIAFLVRIRARQSEQYSSFRSKQPIQQTSSLGLVKTYIRVPNYNTNVEAGNRSARDSASSLVPTYYPEPMEPAELKASPPPIYGSHFGRN
jgi:hypothetical protein